MLASLPPTRLSPGLLVTLLVGATLAALAAALDPLVGLAVALLVLVFVAIRDLPLRRLGAVLVFATALAGIAGPNLAPPGAGWLLGFRVLIVALLIGGLAYLRLGGSIAIPHRLRLPFTLLALWLCWSLVSLGWAQDIVMGLRWTAFLAMMSALAISLALVCGRNTRRVKTLLALLLGAFVVALLFAAAEILLGLRLPSSRPGRDASTIFGATSLFGNQNNFATFLTLSLPYFAVLPLVFRDVRARALGLFGLGAVLLALLFTGSKANIVAAGLIFIALFVILGFDRRMRGRIVGAALIAALAAVLVIPAMQGSGVVKLPEQGVTKFNFGLLAEQLESGVGSGALRSSLAGNGLDLVESSRGLGVGAGNAEVHIKELDAFARVTNLHSWWLEVTVNGGLIALLLFGLFYFGLLIGQLRGARRAPDRITRYLCLAGALSLIGFFAGSFGPSTAIHFAPMWIVFGLGMIAVNLAARRPA